MRWIGLTGGIASGKSSVSELLKELGFPVIDADEIAKKVVAKGNPGLRLVTSHFGADMLNSQGELDRRKLGQVVFGQAEKLRELEMLLHPLVKMEVMKLKTELLKKGCTLAFYDVPLLFEKQMEADFDGILLVTASLETQKKRMRERDGLNDLEIHHRLKAQMLMIEKQKRATWILPNEGSPQELREALIKILPQIQSPSAKP